MNTTTYHRGWWPCVAVLLCSFGLMSAVVLKGHAEPPKTNVGDKTVRNKVDALVNRNRPPKVVERPGKAFPMLVALYPEDYDWKEEARVLKAIDALCRDTTAETWEELVRREKDHRYCVVIATEKDNDAKIRTVGNICTWLAYERLVEVFGRHAPTAASKEGRLIHFLPEELSDLPAWRKKRMNSPLYELQIEAGKLALRELGTFTSVPQEERDKARKAIQAEIEKLKSSKQPILLRDSFPPDVQLLYTEKSAKAVREAVRTGSDKEIELWR